MILDPADLNRRVRIEQLVDDGTADGAGSEEWDLVATVWAQIQDLLPSRGERLVDGVNITARPARVRIRYRDDVTSKMRLVRGDRIMAIRSAPAELGFREGLELIVQDFSIEGSGG